jgi:hypothetical protein
MGLFNLPKPETGLEGSLMTLTDVIAPSAINIGSRTINISGKSARVFYAVSYPRFLTEGWLEPISS